ncbi:ATP-dependent DNA ligase [Bacillus sp. TS-2]|nr:ATP-dependent DNA ligase [Bacillus sp. TS-2]
MDMMKVLNQLLVTLFIFLLIGCQNEEATPIHDLDFVDYAESVSLPNNLTIEFDPSTIKSIDKAKSHSVDFMTFNPEIVASAFLINQHMETENNAFGIQFHSNTENESLIVYDGGESFGTASGLDGGFSYHHDIERNALYSRIASLYTNIPNTTTQLFEYDLNSDFLTFSDLDFLPYLDAKEEIVEQLTNVGFPELELDVVFALDEEMMNTHQEKFLEVSTEETDSTVFEISKDDEAYLFFFRQLTNEIPIINEVWSFNSRDVTDPYEPFIAVLYSESGIIHIGATYLYQILESTEETALIEEAEALQLIIDHYSSIIINQPTAIESMELNYVVIHGEDNFELVPSWIFRLKIADIYEDPIDQSQHDVHSYDYFVINATNGERINGVKHKQ